MDNKEDKKTREEIIYAMCKTWRHDYDFEVESKTDPLQAGMTATQRELLFKQMAQVFDNDIAPHMKLK